MSKTTNDKQVIIEYMLGKASDLAPVQPALDRFMESALVKMMDKAEDGDPLAIDMLMRLSDMLKQQVMAMQQQSQGGLQPGSSH